jgi:type I restriction enzyme S subunit
MSFGYPYITNISGCIHDGWLVIRTPENQINKLYIHSMFLSEYAKQAFAHAAAGAVVQNLNAEKVRRLQVPLPPLAEQHRIVAKVNELMGLCDRLGASLIAAGATRRRLLDALLAETLEPAEVSEVESLA